MSSIVGALSGDERRQVIVDSFNRALVKLPRTARYGDSEFDMELRWVAVKLGLVKTGQDFAWDARFVRQQTLFVEHVTSRLGYEIARRRIFYGKTSDCDQTPQRPFQTYVTPNIGQQLHLHFQQELQRRIHEFTRKKLGLAT